MDAVARILSARTHFDVLELQPPAATQPAVVRRRYKALAMQVHPDKNRGDGAEAAFKRLSEAYECLVHAETQRAYLAELTRGVRPLRRPPPPPPRPQSSATGRPTQPWPPTKPRKSKRKTPPPPPPQEAPAQPTAPPRWRTPEEIWEQFQREEEEQARREFMAKGFDRDFDQRDGGAAAKRGNGGPTEDAVDPGRETDRSVDDDAVEDHAREWSSWKRARVENRSGEEGTSAPEVEKKRMQPSASPCCMICRRKFPTETALARHEQLSSLHKQNLHLIDAKNVAATSTVPT